MTIRVAIVNPVWAPGVSSPTAALDQFPTLTGWADAVAAAGAIVSVHQRFPIDAEVRLGDVPYTFVADTGRPDLGWWPRAAREMAASVRSSGADIVHVNGVVFPGWLRSLRRCLPSAVRIVAQDHGGWHPSNASAWSRAWVRRGLSVVDAVCVSSPGHVVLWRDQGVAPRHVRLVDVMESSVVMSPVPLAEARAGSGVTGDPAILWVGRLTLNKDPMTVLDGFVRFLAHSPGATLTWVFSEGVLESALRQALAVNPRVAAQVRVVGPVPAHDMATYYSSADIFVSGSRMEGSGYAALEALACGVTPVLTNIPSFRQMTGDGMVGRLWEAGCAQSLCDALVVVASQPRLEARARAQARFNDALSWPMIGRRAVAVYRDVCAR
jgi:glycosyltransferase involved in cell wall biosynthesis